MRILALSVVMCAVAASAAPAPEAPAPGDWAQWRGPERTGISTETGLLKEWPAAGPKLAWKVTGLGGGYSTVSIVGNRIYTTGAIGQVAGGKGRGGNDEYAICLDIKDGKQIWATKIGRTAGGYAAPRSTPTVQGGRLYVMSSDGNIVCLGAEKGDVVWKKDLKGEFGGQAGGWAYAESPVIDGDRVVCTPGGDKATLVGLHKDTGKEIWRSAVTGLTPKAGKKGKGRPYNTAAYASIVVGEVAGEKTYVQFLSGGVVGVSAKDGKLLWHYDEPANGTANAATPLLKDNSVFAASGYGNGGGRADVSASGSGFAAKQKYFLATMQNHHGGMVMVDGHVYGTNNSSLVCVNFATGEVVKTVRGAGKGSIVYADGMIYQRGEDGTVCLIEANPATLAIKGQFKQPDRSANKAWAHPVVAGGKLYLRDWDTLLVYDLTAK